MRGGEGDAAATYFGVFDHLVRSEGFSFEGRRRRPATDPVNALLSFMYTLVVHDAASALTAVGLDPAVGFLHEDRSSRPSLALDLAEEFRSVLADRMVLALLNRKQIKPGDFATKPTGEVRLKDESRRGVLVGYQKRKQEIVRHPFLDRECPVGMLLHLQARLLARAIRRDLDAYPPYISK
jgi:CRISPR-associated protein Cas1